MTYGSIKVSPPSSHFTSSQSINPQFQEYNIHQLCISSIEISNRPSLKIFQLILIQFGLKLEIQLKLQLFLIELPIVKALPQSNSSCFSSDSLSFERVSISTLTNLLGTTLRHKTLSTLCPNMQSKYH